MNLQEVYQCSHGRVIGRSPWTWPVWGQGLWYVALGEGSQALGACVVSEVDQRVWALELWDQTEGRAWRWVDPEGAAEFWDYCQRQNLDPDQAWEGVTFEELPDPTLALLTLNTLAQPGESHDPT